MPLFDSNFLKQLEYLSLVSRRVFRGSLLAQRRAKQFGSGIEFAEHREYSAGDDLRYLDWNIYARYGELLIKRFQEEKDLHVYFLLDCSRSMDFPDGRKFDLARQLTAALAYIALADLDRISIIAFADRIVDTLPLTRGKSRILPILGFLESLKPQGSDTDFEQSVGEFIRRKQRMGLAVVLSDFFAPGGYKPGIDLLRHRRYEPHLIQLHHQQEAEPNFLGDIELYDVENNASRKVTVTENNLRMYRRLFAEHRQGLNRYCRDYGMSCTQSSAEIAFDDLVLRMMRAAGALT